MSSNRLFSISFFAMVYMVSSLPAPLPQKEVNLLNKAKPFSNSQQPQTPNCASLLSRSLPECQQRQAQTYGNFGDIWGEINVEVSSPVILITEPEERKKKRKKKCPK